MVPAADRVKKPGQSSVWLDAKGPRSGGGTGRGAAGGGGGRKAEPAAAATAAVATTAAAPALDREKITAVTVGLLDAEGLTKFSMRRLAAELNVTAMSVYWYVATKDDLLELALDQVTGELALPDPGDDSDWRGQLRQLAQSYREMLVGHPWAAPLMSRFLNIGPNMIRFSTASLGLIAKSGVPLERQGGSLAAVFQFVYGYANSEGQFYQRAAKLGLSTDEFYQQAMGKITEEFESSELLRRASAVREARGGGTVAEMYDRDFEVALDVLVAGIEATASSGQSEV
ncbi:TetR/AcrR family transcriptional regulator [Streptomyces sp. NPDC048442]|uniref:TetR/AcrR family transcriptional regulator n=1 Tax=Streptomyces sp. NPDC048442 TaxID=3154823 RepID=UPI00343757FC